jgi:hypothetical protein
MTAAPFHVEVTGERRDTETVMRRLEGGDWKSASTGNSLVAYPTSCPVLRGGESGDTQTYALAHLKQFQVFPDLLQSIWKNQSNLQSQNQDCGRTGEPTTRK